jgi:hypothetical protein
LPDERSIAYRSDAICEWRPFDVQAQRWPARGMQTPHQSLAEVPGASRHKNCHFAAWFSRHPAKLGNNTDKKRTGQREI